MRSRNLHLKPESNHEHEIEIYYETNHENEIGNRKLAKLARIAQEDAENGESSQDEVVVHMRKNLNGTEFD